MYYKDKRVAVTGFSGFIGKELVAALENEGAVIQFLFGDIRDPETFSQVDHNTDYLFHFAAPSSQILFARQPALCTEVTIKGFINAVDACKRSGARLIYPSTGLLSQGRTNEYANCKRFCEEYAAAAGIDSLGIRIFATYGPGEAHKADYASVPYLFARDMVLGKAPVVFGDGSQKRDFVYIDDTAAAILVLADACRLPVIDLGSGVAVTFKGIIDGLRTIIPAGPDAVFVERPGNYVEETLADTHPLQQFYTPAIAFDEGLKRTVESIKETLNKDSAE